MADLAFPSPPLPTAAIEGSARRFPVHRIYCVGRNYVEHAHEMGSDPTRDPPVFFTKPPDAVMPNGAAIPLPPRTANFHHEIELVIAIGQEGREIPAGRALDHVFGYAVGNDLTRRDLQAASKKRGEPWDTGKAFDCSAPLGAIRPASQGHVARGRIWLKVNDELRQNADVSALIWSVPEIIAELSSLFDLRPLRPGDRLEGGIDALETLRNTIVER
jgi:fumarylpyruvate hydrolase